jgi:hypothetical protein
MRQSARPRRFKQPEDKSPKKIRPRGRTKPVKFRQPDPPQRFKAREAPRKIKQPPAWSGADAHLRAALSSSIAGETLSEPSIAVLVPVLSRPHRVQQLVNSFRAATSPRDATLYFIAQRSDTGEVAAIRAAGYEPILVGDEDRSWAKKINRGYEHTLESWLLLGADDLKFHRGWVDVVRKLLRVHGGVIGTNDLGNGATIRGINSTHPLVRRRYAEICGTADERNKVVHEGYDHNFPDTELVVTAKKRGLYVHCVRCVIEHMHPAWGKAKSDAIYALGQASFGRDRELYSRRAARFGW